MNILKEIKLFFQIIFSPKYVKAGKCKQCGKCCRNITFKTGDDFICDENIFYKLQEWQKHYKNFYISGKDEGVLLFTCKSLSDDNKCSKYLTRSLFCRAYPFVKTSFINKGGKTLEGCGYYFKPDKSFEEVLLKMKE